MPDLRILFIINPISGGKRKTTIERSIAEVLDMNKFSISLAYSKCRGHANKLALDAIEKQIDIVVAVGGDGTINEVAAALIGTNKVLGIVPLGSGNGLARFLNIPLSVNQALKLINKTDTVQIDTAILNEFPFVNMAGVGFDAAVSHAFSLEKQRGPFTYARLMAQQFAKFTPSAYDIYIDDVLYSRSAFAISIANSSQYGNNLHISPTASITDGLLDVCIIKPLRWFLVPKFLWYGFFGKHASIDLIEVIRGKHIRIQIDSRNSYLHLDGEPMPAVKNLEIKVNPLSLNVITTS